MPAPARIGVGPSIILGAFVSGVAFLPLTFVQGDLAIAEVSALMFVLLFGMLVYNVNQVSYRQALVPLRLQGRLYASMRTIVWGTLPLGALFGGFLGDAVGLREAILVNVIGGAVAFLWVLLSPVRIVREMPETWE